MNRKFNRTWAIFAAAVVTPALAVANYPGGIAAVVSDITAAQSAGDVIAATEEHNHALTHKSHLVNDRIVIKEGLVTDLIAGRATLGEVTDVFLELNVPEEANMYLIRTRYHGATDAEKQAANVIEYTHLRDLPECEKATVMARLEAEYLHLFGHPLEHQ
jgi:hypothetical protein